jgi:hypothetical protein
MYRILLSIALVIVMAQSCLPPDFEDIGFRPADLRRMLAADTFRVWQLEERWLNGEAVELNSCDTPMFLRLRRWNNNFDSLIYHNFLVSCESTISPQRVRGTYRVAPLAPDERFTDTLFLFWRGDTLLGIVNEVTPTRLRFTYEWTLDSVFNDHFTIYRPGSVNQ